MPRLASASTRALWRVFFIGFSFSVGALAADDPAAEKLYSKHCAACHDAESAEGRIPPRATLAKMRPAAISRSLESGVMKEQGRPLSRTEQRAIANWLGKVEIVSAAADELTNPCPVREWSGRSH